MKKQFLLFTFFLIVFTFEFGAWNLGLKSCSAQDIHFSQFYQTQLLLNPALTGAFNGDHRGFINYKDQWRTVGSPYQTSLLSFDMGLMKKKWKSAYLGTGLTIFRDKAGDNQLGTTQINLSLSSIVFVSENQRISVGLQGGFAQKNINTEKMLWENQFDGTNFNTSLATGETSSFEPYSFGDFSTGLSWSYGTEKASMFSNNEFRANAGVALFHVNKPKQQFNTYQTNDRLNSKIVIHSCLHIGIGNTNYAVQPSIVYWKQGTQQELIFGAFVRYQIRAESKYTGHFKETALSLGGYMRTRDALIPSILLEYSNFALGITYDVNVSSLKEASNKKGGVEISLRYVNPNPFRAGATKSVRFL